MTTDFDAEQVVRDATAALQKKFPKHTAEEILPIVTEELAKLQDRPVQDYLSVLTERAARKRIKDMDSTK